MIRFLTIFGVLCATLLAATPAALADPFEIKCRVMDPTMRINKTQFLGGEPVLVSIRINVGPFAIRKKINVVAVAKVKVNGFNFKAQILEDTIDVPSYHQRQQIAGWGSDAEAKMPNEITIEEEYVVVLPDPLPEGTVKLNVVASLKGRGEQSCKKTIEIL